MATFARSEIDEAKLNEFMGRAVSDMGAAMHAALVVIGDKLGLYKAMAGESWISSAELAAKTKTAERYVREWLNANAASGYVLYDPGAERYQLPPEQASALTVQDLPARSTSSPLVSRTNPRSRRLFEPGKELVGTNTTLTYSLVPNVSFVPITKTIC